MSRLVILAGPSCVGKSPLSKAFHRLYPQQASNLRPLVLFNSRASRPNEENGVDYHFRSRAEIEALRSDSNFAVITARADLQALSLNEVAATIDSGADPFFEGNPFVAREILTFARERSLPVVSVFMSPLSRMEIKEISVRTDAKGLAEVIAELIRRKLLRRTRKQRGDLSEDDLRDIDIRARSAPVELALAHHFEYVLPNHDGEDSDHWDLCEIPLGDAGKALATFAALLEGAVSPLLERWDEDLIGTLP